MQNEVEVIEKKEKKPLSKKRIVAIVAIVLAALLLTPVVNQCVIMAFGGTLYRSASLLQNTHVYAENIYVEGGVLHYTIVNDTIKEIQVTREGGRGIQKLVEGKYYGKRKKH